MAQYNVKFTCGHSESVQQYGPTDQRKRKIEWLERTQVCSSCYRAESDRKRVAETATARENNADMPQLQGTVAQIEWAERIRYTAKQNLAIVVGRHPESGHEIAKSDLAAFAGRVLRQDSAKYWIERRGDMETPVTVAAYMGRRLREQAAKVAGEKAIAEVKGAN